MTVTSSGDFPILAPPPPSWIGSPATSMDERGSSSPSPELVPPTPPNLPFAAKCEPFRRVRCILGRRGDPYASCTCVVVRPDRGVRDIRRGGAAGRERVVAAAAHQR